MRLTRELAGQYTAPGIAHDTWHVIPRPDWREGGS